MVEITANMIKELRERTGVGMGKCKEALVEAKGDMELAISNLRKAGMAHAVKKQGRDTNEGLIGHAETAQTIAVVEVNAETDFVVKNARFQEFARDVANEVAATKPASLEAFLQQKYSKDPELTVDHFRSTLVQSIGENIQISRLKVIAKNPSNSYAVYSHLGGKMVTVVEIAGSNQEGELAKAVAMHVAAAAPEFLSPETVPAETIAHEREIAASQMQGKPQNIIDKILEGKVNSFYDAACLVRQKYIRDDSLTITEFVAKRGKETGKDLKVVSFLRWMVGEKA